MAEEALSWLEGWNTSPMRKAKRMFSLENGRLQSDLITASQYSREPTRKLERSDLQEHEVTGQEGMAKVGWGFEHPGLGEGGGPAPDRAIGTRLSLGSLPNQAILWFFEDFHGAYEWVWRKCSLEKRGWREVLWLSVAVCLQDTDKRKWDSSWRYPVEGQESVCISWSMRIPDWVLQKTVSWWNWSDTSLQKMWGNLCCWKCSWPWARRWAAWALNSSLALN